MKLAVPDLVSNSYFPAEAAVELGCFAEEGLDVELELVFPVDRAYEALREGAVDLVGGAAHAALAAFPNWDGAKLLCAQSQGMYWFLVAHRDLEIARGDLHALRGRTIGAAPWVDMGLQHLCRQVGLDPAQDVRIVGIPAPPDAQPNFGLRAAEALQERQVDAFWANGMAAQLAVQGGFGSVVLDVRRGDGPPSGFTCTLPAIAATEQLVETDPDTAAAVVRAVVRAQKLLQEDVTRAGEIGAKLFPPHEAGLITEIVHRDLPFYQPTLSEVFVEAMNRFARELGLLSGPVPYERVVAAQLAGLRQSGS
ncbi:MAG: ABC transporter substrate-binding protein [bacterium]|jgi:ABC-type nitrate/sulfonate/bicarbonate transport system substrate-binding protein|nr:ABC transporter substrate-binding protein [bacterium]